ncbi:hypothetical protein Tco_1499796 [Tanacetum coccineum]
MGPRLRSVRELRRCCARPAGGFRAVYGFVALWRQIKGVALNEVRWIWDHRFMGMRLLRLYRELQLVPIQILETEAGMSRELGDSKRWMLAILAHGGDIFPERTTVHARYIQRETYSTSVGIWYHHAGQGDSPILGTADDIQGAGYALPGTAGTRRGPALGRELPEEAGSSS